MNYYFLIQNSGKSLNKTKQKKKIKRTEAYLGHLPVAGPAGQLLPLAQPTATPPLCRLPPRQGNGVCPTLAGTRARHLPPCWPPPASFSRPRCPGRSHAAAPHRSHSPSPSSSPPALSLTREPPPPPFAIAITTDLPSPPRHTRKLRSSALKLPVKPCPSGHPVEPSPSPNSTPAAVDPRRRFGSYRASPTSPSRSLVPR